MTKGLIIVGMAIDKDASLTNLLHRLTITSAESSEGVFVNPFVGEAVRVQYRPEVDMGRVCPGDVPEAVQSYFPLRLLNSYLTKHIFSRLIVLCCTAI